MRKDSAKTHGNFKVLVDLAYLSSNFERQKKGTKMNYNAQNKQMSGVEYNKESKDIIFAAMKNCKPLVKIPKENTYNGLVRKYKQVCNTNTHLALAYRSPV